MKHSNKIILIRHGETDYNLGKFSQRPDVPLNQTGINQILESAERLKELNFPFDKIYVSEYTRAQQSAHLIAKILGIDEIEVTPLVNERNAGIFRGMPHEQIKKEYPEHWDFTVNRFDYRKTPPGGEGWADIILRAKTIIERIVESNQHVLVVTHGGFMRSAISHIDGTNIGDLVANYTIVNGQFIEL